MFQFEAPPLIEAPPKIVKKTHEELRKSAPKCVKNNLPYHLDQSFTADIEHWFTTKADIEHCLLLKVLKSVKINVN